VLRLGYEGNGASINNRSECRDVRIIVEMEIVLSNELSAADDSVLAYSKRWNDVLK
jgi:hypothetical protein